MSEKPEQTNLEDIAITLMAAAAVVAMTILAAAMMMGNIAGMAIVVALATLVAIALVASSMVVTGITIGDKMLRRIRRKPELEVD